jgi:hypothetical protein
MHTNELPQRDDLCGAFCGALALGAASIEDDQGRRYDQDAVAMAAGSIISTHRDISTLPFGEQGRRDYRLPMTFIDDPAVSGTTAAGVVQAIRTLSKERLAAIPYSGPWTASTLDGLFELTATLKRPVTLIANPATRHLWGSHPSTSELLGYLFDGRRAGPAADWDVGHFVCIVGRVCGPGGHLYAVADTYPSLGNDGVHIQPRECLASAIERRDKPAGGVIAIVDAQDAQTVREGTRKIGLIEGMWDNGTVNAESSA